MKWLQSAGLNNVWNFRYTATCCRQLERACTECITRHLVWCYDSNTISSTASSSQQSLRPKCVIGVKVFNKEQFYMHSITTAHALVSVPHPPGQVCMRSVHGASCLEVGTSKTGRRSTSTVTCKVACTNVTTAPELCSRSTLSDAQTQHHFPQCTVAVSTATMAFVTFVPFGCFSAASGTHMFGCFSAAARCWFDRCGRAGTSWPPAAR